MPRDIITTAVGTGEKGFAGDGGDGSLATLNSPSGVAIDVAGNIYIADTGNNRVRKINAASGVIATVAGSGAETFSGDGGDATAAGDHARESAGRIGDAERAGAQHDRAASG